jgi:hypothetical protein
MSKRLLYVGLVVLVFAGCEKRRCDDNLREILVLLRAATPGVDLPSDLSKLASFTTNRFLFVCPETHHSVGQLTNVMDWTDYIYISGVEEMGPAPTAVIICPPANHHGKWGYVGFNDGSFRQASPEEVRRLIAEPWSEASDARPEEIQRLKQRIRVVYPKRAEALQK